VFANLKQIAISGQMPYVGSFGALIVPLVKGADARSKPVLQKKLPAECLPAVIRKNVFQGH